MLVALGFLTAALLALTFAPAFWSRAVRLTTQRIKERLPVTETEIRADKDRLRAEFAMTVHRLETKIGQAEMKRARHMIELNRRDANISQLEGELTTLRSSLDEHENARRVLEHTVSDRLPKVETRLDDARKLLATRDSEINDLSSSTSRQQQALDEARSINSQQGAEIERLSTSLTVRGGRNREALNDPSFSGEVALRAEVEGLRAKARDQAGLIARLQDGAPGVGAAHRDLPAIGAVISMTGRTNGLDAASLSSGSLAADTARADLEREVRSLKSKTEDQASEIKTLTAELGALRQAEAASTPDSKVALRARLAGLQTQSDQQADLVRKLRAELAAANERLALQGAQFMEQMRRLGTGMSTGMSSGVNAGINAGAGSANSAQPRRAADPVAPRISLAERVANSRGSQPIAANAEDATEVSGPSASTPAPIPSSSGGNGRLIDRISSLGKV